EDIPAILKLDPKTNQGNIQMNGRQVKILYGKPLGSDELIADLIFKRAQEVL
ncbi:MAG: sirohydrochlorin nickelochelatase, partial [Methanomethylovorans sp.]|nr:sirohydrochlorin nickelochelatase [Methanomethylovorans sp.]